MKNNSKVIKKTADGWHLVERKDYKTDTTNFKNISRYSLLGEGDAEHELNFQTRYFEIQPGGYSSLEMHRHPHSVIIVKGSGSVILGDEVHTLATHDVVFISPESIHQFHADNGEELGFICVVDRYRDKPAIPDNEIINRVMGTDSEARMKMRK